MEENKLYLFILTRISRINKISQLLYKAERKAGLISRGFSLNPESFNRISSLIKKKSIEIDEHSPS